MKKIQKPSDFLLSLSIIAGAVYLLWCRVSSCQQKKRGNLDGQEDAMTALVEGGGATVGRTERVVWSGSGYEYKEKWKALIVEARELDAIILAYTPCRVYRHPEFRANHKVLCRLQPTPMHWQELKDVSNGVPVMTVIHPDSTSEECKATLTKLGQKTKGKRGGRPAALKEQEKKERFPRKQFREEWEPYVIEYYLKPGWQTKARRIAGKVSRESGVRVTERTVRNWINDYLRTSIV